MADRSDTKTSERDLAPAQSIAVRRLLEHPKVSDLLSLEAGRTGLDRVITHPRVQKNGLALAGHARGTVSTRVQILGETEVTYLEAMSTELRERRIRGYFGLELSCVIVTRGVAPMAALQDGAAATETPLLLAKERSSHAISRIHFALDDLLAPKASQHGNLVEIHGLGVLLLGPSGIGKSECALFLVERGHRLVADDRVELTRLPDGRIVGRPAPLLRHHLEVRGIGILNVRDLFGATAVQERTDVDLVCELVPFDDGVEFERLGLDELRYDVLGTPLPLLRIPIRPGRNMAVILEVAARNLLLKRAGHHAARAFTDQLATALGLPTAEPDRGTDDRTPGDGSGSE